MLFRRMTYWCISLCSCPTSLPHTYILFKSLYEEALFHLFYLLFRLTQNMLKEIYMCTAIYIFCLLPFSGHYCFIQNEPLKRDYQSMKACLFSLSLLLRVHFTPQLSFNLSSFSCSERHYNRPFSWAISLFCLFGYAFFIKKCSLLYQDIRHILPYSRHNAISFLSYIYWLAHMQWLYTVTT